MPNLRRQRRLFLLFILPAWALLTLAAVAWLAWEVEERRDEQARDVAAQVRQVVQHAELEIKNLVSDAALLAMQHELRPMQCPQGDGRLARLGQAYLSFCRSKPGYLDIRLLDASGRQVLRVDGRHESLAVCPQEAPLSPQVAAMASQALLLAPHELILSSVRPRQGGRDWLIRLALPIIGEQGRRWGVLMIDYSGAEFVGGLRRGLAGPGQLWLFDRWGRPLHCELLAEPGDATGPDPAVPTRCNEEAPIMVQGEIARPGLLGEAIHFHPLRQALRFSTGGGEATLTSAKAAQLAGEQRWTLMVQRRLPRPDQLLSQAVIELSPTYLALVLTLVIAAWLISVLVSRRLEAQRDRRLAEERFRIRTAFDHSAVGIAVISLEGVFLEANDSLTRLLEVERDQLIGQGFEPYIHAQDLRRLRLRLDQMLNAGRPGIWMELRLQTAGGETRWVLLSASLAKDHTGRPLHGVAHLQDITEAKELAAEKQAMEAELRRALKLEAIGILASGVAHDFNNILGIMLTNTELCLKYDSENLAAMKRRLEQVMKAGERGRDLVRQIMNIYKPQEKQREPIRLSQVLDETMKLMATSIPPNVRLDSRLPQPGPVVVASLSEIQQVVTNLCVNALHAMGADGGQLTVSLSQTELHHFDTSAPPDAEPQAWTLLKVEDTGCGMDEATIAKAFDPFFTTKGQGEGTGLGLATVQRVVGSLGGQVGIQSTPGQGTVVSLRLPVSDREPIAHRPLATPRTSGGSLLVVDDEVAYAEALGEALGSFGFQVTVLGDPQEALGLIQAEPRRFAALVTDHHMPGLSGAELCQSVSQLNPHLPVVLCTGSPQHQEPKLAAEAGSCRILPKPFTILEMLEVLEDLLGDTADEALAAAES